MFAAEFTAMNARLEGTPRICYKLCMMGIPVEGPSYFYDDNMSVIHNVTRPKYTLKKKRNSVCYRAVRESDAMKETICCHMRSEENMGDIANKIMCGGKKQDGPCGRILYDFGPKQ